jgi:hypothetical protein
MDPPAKRRRVAPPGEKCLPDVAAKHRGKPKHSVSALNRGLSSRMREPPLRGVTPEAAFLRVTHVFVFTLSRSERMVAFAS